MVSYIFGSSLLLCLPEIIGYSVNLCVGLMPPSSSSIQDRFEHMLQTRARDMLDDPLVAGTVFTGFEFQVPDPPEGLYWEPHEPQGSYILRMIPDKVKAFTGKRREAANTREVGDQRTDYGHTGYQPRRQNNVQISARARMGPQPSQQSVIKDDDCHDWFWRKKDGGIGVTLDTALNTNQQHAGYHSRQTNEFQKFQHNAGYHSRQANGFQAFACHQNGRKQSQLCVSGPPAPVFEDPSNLREQRRPHMPSSPGLVGSGACQDQILLKKCGPRQMRLRESLQTHGPRPRATDPSRHRLRGHKAWLKDARKASNARKRIQRAIHDHRRGKPFWTQRGRLAPLKRALRK